MVATEKDADLHSAYPWLAPGSAGALLADPRSQSPRKSDYRLAKMSSFSTWSDTGASDVLGGQSPALPQKLQGRISCEYRASISFVSCVGKVDDILVILGRFKVHLVVHKSLETLFGAP